MAGRAKVTFPYDEEIHRLDRLPDSNLTPCNRISKTNVKAESSSMSIDEKATAATASLLPLTHRLNRLLLLQESTLAVLLTRKPPIMWIVEKVKLGAGCS